MSKIPSPHFQMESWYIFSISSLINFGIVYIWPIYQSLGERILFTVLFFFHSKKSRSVRNFDFSRWGTHLYISLFLSICPSVAYHISGTIHHLIIICGTHVLNDDISMQFFSFFLNFRFLGCYGGKRAKISPKWKNNYICHTSYVRNSTVFDYNFWYTFVKWYLQVFFVLFSFLWSFHFSVC